LFLFEIRPHDVWVLSSAAVVVASCVLLAGALPAWRASQIDPMQALRHE
jgi:ABC-type lipoprotein release transport system permease subunit